MQLRTTIIEDTFAEAFRVWAGRLIITAIDAEWVRIAASVVCGYATSVIGCDAEAGIERLLDPGETPDGRPGAALLFFAFNAEKLAKAVPNRVGQCLMTCPTTAVYDGMPEVHKSEDSARLDLGKRLRFFGDGNQKSKVLAGRRYWRVPVMDGEFLVEDTFGAVKAIGGGNILICGRDQPTTLAAARQAVAAIDPLPGVITPFPGGVVRSGSKVGSRYKALFASTNDAYCPTLRGKGKTQLAEGVGCVYEIVINGLSKEAIAAAMRAGIEAACGEDVTTISAGNYGGNLGKFHFKLHEVMSSPSPLVGEGGPAMPDRVRGEPPKEKSVPNTEANRRSETPPSPQPSPTRGEGAGGYTLTWKSGAPLPVDGSFLRADTLCKLDPETLGDTPVRMGGGTVPLRELFEIHGSPGGEEMTVAGAPPLDRIGAGMSSGILVINGDVGDDLGASMSGGRVHVFGSADHRIGGPDQGNARGMTGGEIIVEYDAGDYAGFRMRRGLIAIFRNAGKSPGCQMIAGTIFVGQGPLDAPGLEMRRGTIVSPWLSRPQVSNGHLVPAGEFPAAEFPMLGLLFRRLKHFGWQFSPSVVHGRYALLSGDRFELGKGEVWQWLS